MPVEITAIYKIAVGVYQLSFGVICSQHRDSAPKDGVFIMTNHPAVVPFRQVRERMPTQYQMAHKDA